MQHDTIAEARTEGIRTIEFPRPAHAFPYLWFRRILVGLFCTIHSSGFTVSVATNMDLLICAGLAAIEVLAADRFWLKGSRQNSLPVLYTAIFTSLAQYLTLKIYRIFLYHRYFSPLRHLPGPTVRRLGS